MQDVDSVNLVELSDTVSKLKQWDVVHCHPECLMSAKDLHLEQDRTLTMQCFYQDCKPSDIQCPNKINKIHVHTNHKFGVT